MRLARETQELKSPEVLLRTAWCHVAARKQRVLINPSFQRQLLLFARMGCRWFPTLANEVLGLLSLNNEQKVCKKMRGKGMPSISYEDRAHLVQLATADVPWMSFNPMREQDAAKSIQLKWPNLRFIRYELNGADDVCRFAKWRWCSPSRRFITMGRPHFTAEVIKGATRAQDFPPGSWWRAIVYIRDGVMRVEQKHSTTPFDLTDDVSRQKATTRVKTYAAGDPWLPAEALPKLVAAATTSTSLRQRSVDEQPESVASLVNMGFSEEQAKDALDMFRGNVERAAEYLSSAFSSGEDQKQPVGFLYLLLRLTDAGALQVLRVLSISGQGSVIEVLRVVI
eukprot:g27136.t1